jgi:two-component system sensor histidine kinase UhpB
MALATARWLSSAGSIGLASDAGPWRVRHLVQSQASILPRGAALAVAYYVAASVGFAFTLPGAPQSILWLPNSLLLAALLVSPPGNWPLLLASAFPAHMLVAWQGHEPLSTLALLYFTNCLDAAIAAAAVQWCMRGPWRMDGLAGLFVFLAIGATVGPLLVSFADAGITVWSGWGEDFWAAYRRRLRSNTLTNVILVPALVGAFAAVQFRRPLNPRRTGEAIAVFGGLLLICAVVFSRSVAAGPGWLYLPLPFLLWIAVRFGPGATGGALLVVAFVSSWYAVQGMGAFAGQDPARNVVALQFFLLSAALPLLGFSMVIREREIESQQLIESRDMVRRSTERVRQLAGQLISAQEAERSRIARKLHDDIGQYITDVAVSMSSMKRSAASRKAGLDSEFDRLYQHTTTLFENVRELSHELHPSVVQHAGLVAAMGSLCRGFSERYGIPVAFEPTAVDPVADGVALAAYRVAQEGLTNIARHARAKRARVAIARRGPQLLVTIEDDGRGFNKASPTGAQGLGLLSMEERVRLLNGAIEIVSGDAGTRVTAIIPLEPLA